MTRRIRTLLVIALLSAIAVSAFAQKPPLLSEKDVAALAQELSGEIAKRNLEGITRFHRQRGSQGFHSAAEIILERARAYGLTDAQILQFPADGKIYYGTQRSRPPWDAEFAELWEMKQGVFFNKTVIFMEEKEVDGKKVSVPVLQPDNRTDRRPPWLPYRKLASYEAEPVTLAEDSESADVTANLIDVGDGTKESDYAGKNVKGQIVLVAAQPGAVQDLAVGKFGAAGIVSYAQNQKTAWSGEDENLIRWGHLESFSPNKTFAFMFSLKTAREYQARLASGEKILLHAIVKAGQHPGFTELVTATIPGVDPQLKNEEIAFSCHLDHQRPGANDNASGCVTILEVARTLQRLISEHKIEPPARTIRFIWPPEVEGTLTLLNAKPEFAQRIKAVIHMDMVGGNQNTKSVFHVTRGPMSLPSFVYDVAWAFGNFVNEQSYNFAAGLPAQYPLVSPEGGKEPLQALDAPYSMGSDHDVYQDSSFKIPAIYLNDWPDRYIHTNFDTAANIDPTKLKRAAFIGAASGYYLVSLTQKPDASALTSIVDANRSARMTATLFRASQLSPDEKSGLLRAEARYEEDRVLALQLFTLPRGTKIEPIDSSRPSMASQPKGDGDGLLIFKRKPEPKGPLTVFGSDYFADRAKGAGISTAPRVLEYEGLWGSGEEYAYEILNFADGRRNAQQIRDSVSAEYGPITLDFVVEYLKDLEKIGILEQVK
jgi:aminopeptidase YwaD